MNYLTLENASLRYGEKLLFDRIDLYINQGQKIALIAENGSGKSTLIRILNQEIAPDGDQYNIYHRHDIRIGYLPQEPLLNPNNTVLEEVFQADDPSIKAVMNYEEALLANDEQLIAQATLRIEEHHAWDAKAKAEEILHRLKIFNFDQKVKALSGGQAKRLALAKIAITTPDFLILDEPTNHLDIDMIEWLEHYLSSPGITLFMVTHDRYFLERVCDQIIELDRGKLFAYPGNYSTFLERKALREEIEKGNILKHRKLMKHELEWVRRMPKARSTKAKSRLDKFEEIKSIARNQIKAEKLSIPIQSTRLGSKILECHDVSKSFDSLTIIDHFNYKFKKGECIGIVGPNGVGKTTLVNILTGQLRPDSGKVVIGETVQFGFYRQSGLLLDQDKRVIDVIRDIAEYLPLKKGQKLSAEQLLEHFLFSRAKQQVFASQLSGGEKRRIHLLQVLMANPNFLILDEPTNDLDIVTLNILENFLLQFEGCIIVITHDRYFLDKLADHLFIMDGNGQILDYNGKYHEYRQQKSDAGLPLNLPKKPPSIAPSPSRNDYLLEKEKRKKIRKIERELAKLEKRKKEILDWFAQGIQEPDELRKFQSELAEINDSITDKEMEWMELV